MIKHFSPVLWQLGHHGFTANSTTSERKEAHMSDRTTPSPVVPVQSPPKPFDPFHGPNAESSTALPPAQGTEAVLGNQKRPSNRQLRRQGLLPRRDSMARALLDEDRWANRER